MHPEIREFFEVRGRIYAEGTPDDMVEYYQVIKQKYVPIALWSPTNKWEFNFSGRWYTEGPALHIIKLKAFL